MADMCMHIECFVHSRISVMGFLILRRQICLQKNIRGFWSRVFDTSNFNKFIETA